MKLERTMRFRVDFKKPWAQYSAALMGLFVFLRAVCFFACRNMAEVPSGELWLHLIIPLALGIAYIGLLRGAQLNVPVVYGGAGAAYCLLMIVYNLQYGASFGVILAVIWYILAALVLLATVLGFLPNRLYMTIAFAVAVALQLLTGRAGSYLTELQIGILLRESSNLFGTAAFACLAPALAGRIISG